MKTFIVPIDFTEESVQGAMTAAQLVATVDGGRIVLYHVYAKITAGIDGSPLTDDTDARRKITAMAFENVRTQLLGQHPSLEVRYHEEEGSTLVENLQKFARRRHADFIIMHVSEASAVQHFLFGSNAVDVAKQSICPVIILPSQARFKGVKNILFASDFKDVVNTTPIAAIRAVLSLFESTVHVIHVAAGDSAGSDELQQQKVALREMLIQYRPEFHVLEQTDFMEAVDRIVAEHDIDMILTVPHTHGFFDNIFGANHTKKLAYQSTIPVIAVHA